MKTYIILITILLFTVDSFSQEIKNVDFISPLHEKMAAVQSGENWGFMNADGVYTIAPRKDLAIPLKTASQMPYPYFSQGRVLFMEVRENIEYYGFINTTGEIAILPKYIEVTPFNEHGKALALELFKQQLGENGILQKQMVRYVYREVVIDTTGTTVSYLKDPQHIIPMRDQMKRGVKITSYFISDVLVAVKNNEGSWDIVNITKN
ncbi:MAG: hypothetical protein ACI828_000328 [Flavobacteriales bacterium]|jgi:hypothetical protein